MASELNNEFDSDAPASDLDRAIFEFLAAQESGVPIDVPAFLKKHATVADELDSFIHQQMQMGRLMSPVRRIAELAKLPAPEFDEFGDYTIFREIGRGGMGVIYEAQQQGLKRRVALKMIRENRFVTNESLIRFQAEAEAAAALEHPNIVPVYRVGNVDGRPFFTMKLVKGGSLKERLAAGPLPAKESARIARLIAEAVSFAHQHGILHRDLKPANILLDARSDTDRSTVLSQHDSGADSGPADSSLPASELKLDSDSNREALVNPVITDFGLAKQMGDEFTQGLTMTGAVLGTPSFMSPEQAAGESALTTATDIYSVGAILFNMLTGKPPFEGKSPGEITRKVIHQVPRWQSGMPWIDTDLRTICLKCLEKSPADRYSTATELTEDLQLYLAGKPILARRASTLEQTIKWAKRNPWLAATFSLVAALLLLTLVGSIFFSWRLNLEVAERGAALQKLQIQETKTAKQRDQALRLLFESKSQEVSARRSSGESGHRIAAIAAAREAVNQLPMVAASEKEIFELRSETAGCLGNIDIVELSQWTNADYYRMGQRFNFSRDLELVATHPFRGSPLRIYTTQKLGEFGSDEHAEPVATFDIGHARISGPFRLEISECTSYLLANALDGSTIKQFVFDLKNKTTILNKDHISHACIGYKNGNTLIATATAASISICRLPRLEKVISFPNPSPSTNNLLRFSPDGRWLARHGAGGFYIFDVSNGDMIWQNPDRSNFDLDWHPTEPEIAVTNFLSAEVWRLEDDGIRLVNEFPGHNHKVYRVTYTPDGSSIATSTWNGNTKFWNVRSGEKLFSSVGSIVRFSEDGSKVAMQGAKAGIFRFEGERLRKTISTADEKNEASQPVDVDVHPGNRWVALGTMKGVRIGDLRAGTRLIDLPSAGRVRFHPEGSYLLTGWHSVVQWPIREELTQGEDGETTSLILGPPKTLMPTSVWKGMDLDPTGNFIAIINEGGRTLVMPIENLENAVEMQNSSAARDVSLSRDARLVAVGNHHSRNAQVFDGRTGKLLHTVDTPSHARARLSPSGDILVVTFDNSAEVYDTVTWELLYSLKEHDFEVSWPASFTNDDKQLLFTLRKPRGTLIVDARTGKQLIRIPGDAGTAPRDTDPVLTTDQQVVMIREGNSLESWDLARIRNQLAEIGLDWEQDREIHPVSTNATLTAPEVKIDWGDSNRRAVYQDALRRIRSNYGKRAAELAFEDWQRDYPNDADLWDARGHVHSLFQNREAINDWSKATSCENCDPVVWYSRAIAGIKFNQRDQVVSDLTRFLSEQPASVAQRMSASRLLAWEFAINLKGRELDKSELNKALGLATEAKAWASRVENDSGVGQSVNSSVGKLIDKTLALVHLRSGEPELAMELLGNISPSGTEAGSLPASGAEFITGLAWHAMGENEKAKEWYQRGAAPNAEPRNISANQAVDWLHLKSELASALEIERSTRKFQRWTPIELAAIASWDFGDVGIRSLKSAPIEKLLPMVLSKTISSIIPRSENQLVFSTRRGGRLTLRLHVEKGGTHDGVLSLTRAEDFGKFKLYFNGQNVGTEYDGYTKSIAGSEQLRLEELEFHPGENELVLESVGKSPRSSGFHVGVLEFRMEKTEQ